MFKIVTIRHAAASMPQLESSTLIGPHFRGLAPDVSAKDGSPGQSAKRMVSASIIVVIEIQRWFADGWCVALTGK